MSNTERTPYPSPLVWWGLWKSPHGLPLQGHHVWDAWGRWVGVYESHRRAEAEADAVRTDPRPPSASRT